jgi:hypothetical protein
MVIDGINLQVYEPESMGLTLLGGATSLMDLVFDTK